MPVQNYYSISCQCLSFWFKNKLNAVFSFTELYTCMYSTAVLFGSHNLFNTDQERKHRTV